MSLDESGEYVSIYEHMHCGASSADTGRDMSLPCDMPGRSLRYSLCSVSLGEDPWRLGCCGRLLPTLFLRPLANKFLQQTIYWKQQAHNSQHPGGLTDVRCA